MVDRQNLFIVNSWDKCEELITRERVTVLGKEKSVIDFVIVCDGLKDSLESMIVDDRRDHVLTNSTSRKGKRIITKSDHNIPYCKFSLNYNIKRKVVCRERFQLKDNKGQELFLKETSVGEAFSGIFALDNPFLHNSNIFFGRL